MSQSSRRTVVLEDWIDRDLTRSCQEQGRSSARHSRSTTSSLRRRTSFGPRGARSPGHRGAPRRRQDRGHPRDDCAAPTPGDGVESLTEGRIVQISFRAISAKFREKADATSFFGELVQKIVSQRRAADSVHPRRAPGLHARLGALASAAGVPARMADCWPRACPREVDQLHRVLVGPEQLPGSGSPAGAQRNPEDAGHSSLDQWCGWFAEQDAGVEIRRRREAGGAGAHGPFHGRPTLPPKGHRPAPADRRLPLVRGRRTAPSVPRSACATWSSDSPESRASPTDSSTPTSSSTSPRSVASSWSACSASRKQ